MQDPCAIGIMHDAFQKGSKLLVSWINDILQINYKKVENLHSGAAYCQLCHILYGQPKMSSVKWSFEPSGKSVRLMDSDKASNWKKVQSLFTKKGIKKKLEVTRYLAGKFQDNLEIFQWFKHFFEFYYDGSPYDAPKSRWGKKCKTSQGEIVLYWDESTRALVDGPTTVRSTSRTSSPKPKVSKKKKASKGTKTKSSKDLEKQHTQLLATVSAVEKERNFYFGKLREIEILCQGGEPEDEPLDYTDLAKQILSIMYKTEDEGDNNDEKSDKASDEYSVDNDDTTF